ncbi:hypothetical protein MASR2M15_22310 [Anaerolineales bacterium]
MSQPLYALSLFVHILSTLIWIGGLWLTILLVWPELRRALENKDAFYQLLSRWRKRFFAVSNLCLVALIATGLFQMTADPYYNGFIQFDNDWSKVMLAKHGLIVLMAIAGLVLQFIVVPSLERQSILLQKDGNNKTEWQRLRRQEIILTWLSAILGFFVVGLSVWAATL